MFNPNDYETPEDKAKKIAGLVKKTDQFILEPCAGVGQIAKYLPSFGDRVTHANEINPIRYEKGKENAPWIWWLNTDFLGDDWVKSDRPSAKYDLVVSNPPFGKLLQFIERSLLLLNPKNPDARIIFLLPIDWMGAKGRASYWRSLDAHVSQILVLEGRTDYLMDGVPCSKVQKRDKQGNPVFKKNGEPQMMSGRQVTDACFVIRPGKGGFVDYL